MCVHLYVFQVGRLTFTIDPALDSIAVKKPHLHVHHEDDIGPQPHRLAGPGLEAWQRRGVGGVRQRGGVAREAWEGKGREGKGAPGRAGHQVSQTVQGRSIDLSKRIHLSLSIYIYIYMHTTRRNAPSGPAERQMGLMSRSAASAEAASRRCRKV